MKLRVTARILLGFATWALILMACQKLLPRAGPLAAFIILPLAAVERRLARMRCSGSMEPRVGALAYAHFFAGAAVLVVHRTALVSFVVLGVGGIAVAVYRVLGRRFHFILGFVAVLLVPLLSFGPAYEAVPLDLDDDEARATGVPSWFIALWVWAPTPMPAGVAVAVVTAVHWLVEWNEYRRELRANASAESCQSPPERAPLESASHL